MPDEISVVAKVVGVTTPADEFIVDVQAAQVDESLHMEAWLEPDGQRIGPSVGLWDKPREGTVITVWEQTRNGEGRRGA